ncbi:MAG: hypothetical protein RSB59_01770 [Clostridia bacterium]
MKEVNTENCAISKEDLLDGGDFVAEYSVALGQFANRLAGTETETACARSIRDRLQSETGAKVRLEAFRAKPYVGRGMFPFLGLWFLFSMVLYYLSFAGGRVAGALLTLLALCVFLTGGAVLVSLFLGFDTFKGLVTSKTSYNVVSESAVRAKDNKKTKTIIIADNHDAVLGSYFQNFGAFRKIAFIFAPVTAILFVLFCVLKMAIGATTPVAIAVFTILPTINGIIGIFVIATHFSPFEKHARQNNGIGTAVAMATYAYFVEYPELLPENTKIVYVSFGAENSAHGGSEAFVATHKDYDGVEAICVGDILSKNFQVAECDAVRKISFSTHLVSTIRSAAHGQGIDFGTVNHTGISHTLNSLHGYASNAFAKRHMDTATVVAKDYSGGQSDLDRGDVERLFSLLVGAVKKLAEETANDDDDKIETVNLEQDSLFKEDKSKAHKN